MLQELLNFVMTNTVITKLATMLGILIAAIIAQKLFNKTLNKWHKKFIKKLSKIDSTIISAAETKITIIQKIANAAIYFLVLILFLLQFDAVRNIGTGLLASAGVAGIVIGMAAQNTISNIIAGISISFAQPIRLNDAVIFEGDFGWIEEISLMHTIIRTWDNRRIVAPNSVIANKVLQNWTIKDQSLLGVVMVHVDYTCDVEKVREWVKEIVDKSSYSTDERVTVVHVVDLTDKCMVLRILGKGPDAPTTWNLRCELREKLIKKFKEEGIPLPRIRIDSDIKI